MSSYVKFVLVVLGTILVSNISASGASESGLEQTPCGIALTGIQQFGTTGLTPVNGGSIIYDSNQQLCWLTDANLAGNLLARAQIRLSKMNPDGSTPLINPDGTMDYQTALNWVNALNSFNNGKGWLNHNNWQLPTTQNTDDSCSSEKGGNFGALCKGSALGDLYNQSLKRVYPHSVVPRFFSIVWPFFDLQPGLYWTGTSRGEGQSTFSFNTGDDGANTTDFNFLHVLPMTHDMLGNAASGVSSCSVVPYISGPGAGKAVFDSCTGLSWPMNANLPADNHFGFDVTTVLNTAPNQDVNHTAFPMTVPMIDPDGAVHFAAVDPCAPPTATDQCPPATSGWIVSMNNANYAGSSHWMLPGAGDNKTPGDLDTLFKDLRLQPGDIRLEWQGFVGPFWHLQPGFYWTCERDDMTGSQASCNPILMPGQDCSTKPDCPPQDYSFNFDDGFEGTDHPEKHFYVMVYFPARQ